jgi:queuine/archaeosine tRNA-ribosyltransferase
MTVPAKEKSIGSKTLAVPNLFASYRLGDFPRAGLHFHPWKVTGTQGLLLNAFDLLGNKRTKLFSEAIRTENQGLNEYVEFGGPVVLDSGAFNFLQQDSITIRPNDVLNVAIKLRADVGVVLDHPFPHKALPAEIRARWQSTLHNTREMVRLLSQRKDQCASFRLMPVLHGHDSETLKRAVEDIVRIFKGEPPIVGIGSLAPLALNGSKRTVIDVILTARELLPNAHIHCFSLGSALLMLFAFYCGADTVDSQTWIMSAAFKDVQLPGFHMTRLSQREAERDRARYRRVRMAFAKRLVQLAQQERFAIKDWETGSRWGIKTEGEALDYLTYLEDAKGTNHVHRRACHNLYAFNFEAGRVRQELATCTLEAFIVKRMKSTVYRRAFDYAVMKRTQSV